MSDEIKSSFLHKKRRLRPPAMARGSDAVVDLVDTYFNAFNAARIREACEVLVRAINEGSTVGLSLSGALTPAGLSSVITPLIENGFVDYIASTGANLYHDLHFDLDLALYRGAAEVTTGGADLALKKEQVIRVYDVLFPADVLYKTDEWMYRVMMADEFHRRMGTAELHHLLGKYALETCKKSGVEKPSILAVAHQCDVPIYVPSPGDSTIGLNVAALYTANPERGPRVDPSIDVAEMTAIVYDTKCAKENSSAIWVLGGGAPKNFLLQTEPQLQEILGVDEKGHDYFVQITDARADTGGLSGATPSEAMSWGKVDPEKLSDSVVAYVDSTIALPIIASYVMAKCKPREPSRLYLRRDAMVDKLREVYRGTEIYKRYWG